MLTNYERRKFRTRNRIAASNKSGRPRASVYRSNKNIFIQLIDSSGKVLCASSTLGVDEKKKASGIEQAKTVGKEFAKICLKHGIKEIVFDKGAYVYN
ncbi:MAG: 50S ribosomal protein L18, partial [Alphaproteobacteria bacterium]|nr:50S ribosomal protein L18 [Alphaproteobacteria bacterium]